MHAWPRRSDNSLQINPLRLTAKQKWELLSPMARHGVCPQTHVKGEVIHASGDVSIQRPIPAGPV